MGGLANADVIRGGGRSMPTVADRGGGKICQNLADVICERSLNVKQVFVQKLFLYMSL